MHNSQSNPCMYAILDVYSLLHPINLLTCTLVYAVQYGCFPFYTVLLVCIHYSHHSSWYVFICLLKCNCINNLLTMHHCIVF